MPAEAAPTAAVLEAGGRPELLHANNINLYV
jgi:hypothetical protein